MISLLDSIRVLPGTGPARAAALEAVGVATLQDLLLLLPKGYRPRARAVPIADLVVGAHGSAPASVFPRRFRISSECDAGGRTAVRPYEGVVGRGRIAARSHVAIDGIVRSYRSGRRRGSPSRLVVADSSGEIEALLFSVRRVPRSLARGRRVFLEGDVAERDGKRQLVVRHYETEDDRRDGRSLVPLYELPDNVPPRLHARWIETVAPALAPTLPDWRDDAGLGALRGEGGAGLLAFGAAVALAHRPRDESDVAAATRRLGYEEFVAILRPLLERRRALSTVAKPHGPIALSAEDRDRLVARLAFAPTRDQRSALESIADDLGSSAPMHRLLHGEVGSGKTAVALLALLAVTRAGWQCALLTPTAILAAQHATVAERLFTDAGIPVFLLTRQTRAAERRAILEKLRAGVPALVIGTVRLFSALEAMPRLALAVVDEQQRFGVSQRARMRGRGKVDLLVMTATPIPRSLALVLYGDLDLTVIRELPPGRGPVATTVHDGAGVLREVAREVERGGRVFVVCPQIGTDGGQSRARDSVATATRIAREMRQVLAKESGRVALVHGRRNAAENAAALVEFRAGVARVLVSTVVIEVGIDVAAATLIVVLDADRFGLAQLHQLRGRVGRGGLPGRCILVPSVRRDDAAIRAPAESIDRDGDARPRLAALVRFSSGFDVAEADLAIRGPGEVFGGAQHGTLDLRFASLPRDADLLAMAREDVERAIERGSRLSALEAARSTGAGPG